jgi:hypothetical protein
MVAIHECRCIGGVELVIQRHLVSAMIVAGHRESVFACDGCLEEALPNIEAVHEILRLTEVDGGPQLLDRRFGGDLASPVPVGSRVCVVPGITHQTLLTNVGVR